MCNIASHIYKGAGIPSVLNMSSVEAACLSTSSKVNVQYRVVCTEEIAKTLPQARSKSTHNVGKVRTFNSSKTSQANLDYQS